jgi:type IV pilus assembly protein PilA
MLEFFGKRIRYMQEVPREEQGFTLMELLIVIIIIGILAAIAIPAFLAQREKAQAAAVQSDTRNAATAEALYFIDNDEFTNTVADLEPEGFRQSGGVTTTVTGAPATYCVKSVWTADPTNPALIWYMDEAGGGVSQTAC